MTALERWEPPVAPALNDEDMRSIEFQARAIAVLDDRLKRDKDRAEKALGLAITLYNLRLPITPVNAKKLHLINGEIVESAQLLINLLTYRGHDVRVVQESDTKAVVTGRRFGKGEPHKVTYTIEDAQRSGALDTWVEHWEKNDEGNWRKIGQFTLAIDGVPTGEVLPAWAKKQVDAGKVKRMDAWHKYRTDMLVNRALRRLAKRMGGGALLGVAEFDPDDMGEPVRSRPPLDTREYEDDDIADAELVDDAQQDATRGEPHGVTAPSGDDGAAVEADGGANPVAEPADGPGGHDSGAAAPEPVPANEAGGVSEGSPAGAAPSHPRPPSLVSEGWVRHVAIVCTNAGLDRDQRLVLIEHAIGRPVETSQAVRQGAEAQAVDELLVRLAAGEVVVAMRRDGPAVVEVDPAMRGQS